MLFLKTLCIRVLFSVGYQKLKISASSEKPWGLLRFFLLAVDNDKGFF